MIKKALFLICFVMLFGCGEKFNAENWANTEGGHDKYLMAKDLIVNHTLIGLTRKKMLLLLGEPSNYEDTTKTYYRLSEEYDMIDPISGKDLIITFNKDSIITKADIKDWHKH